MPSAAGKRVGRVLAGVRSHRREISPDSSTWQEILGFSRDLCIGQHSKGSPETMILVEFKVFLSIHGSACVGI